MASAAPAARRKRAVETFNSAAETIGPVHPGMSIFAITRGQFSMLDAVLHVIEACAPADVTLWTWRIAAYELEVLQAFLADSKIRSGVLFLDYANDHASMRTDSAKQSASRGVDVWLDRFGPDSVRIVSGHAKIATVEGNGMRVLLRGSMNLNFNPRFEQLDITEGGPDFDLVRRIESELPVMPRGSRVGEVRRACKLTEAFEDEELTMFGKTMVWAK